MIGPCEPNKAFDMDDNQAPKELILPSGIHRLSSDLLFCICDYLSIPDVCHFSTSSRALRMSLEYHLYIKMAMSLKTRFLVRKWDWTGSKEPINPIRYGLLHNWNSDSLGLAITAARQVWQSLLDNPDGHFPYCYPVPPLLFLAIEKNRMDIVSLLVENLADINIRYWDVPSNIPSSLTAPWSPLEQSFREYFDSKSPLEVAIWKENLELTEKFLANPNVLVRPTALCQAVSGCWNPGVAAVLACGRLEQAQVANILNRALFHCAFQVDKPDWIEYLVSVGADAHWSLPPGDVWHKRCATTCYADSNQNCRLHYPRNCVPYCRTVLSCSLTGGRIENVKKLLEIVPFGEDYMIHCLRQAVWDDRLLEITKIILHKTNSSASTWAEAYAAAVNATNDLRCYQNEQTLQFLLDYGPKLRRSVAEFNLTTPLKDSAETLLEHVLMAMNKQPSRDWAWPLFQFDVVTTLLSAHGWKLFREYLHVYVLTQEMRDGIIASCKRTLAPDETQGVRVTLFVAQKRLLN
ncbi:hypothetical protein F4803DRAFT_533514 [Xylaria telfairii]|nr:hypothetical protein F4803DRAFT_533514 [Xylaria telfairii]